MKKLTSYFLAVALLFGFQCRAAFADDNIRTNIGFPTGYAENFDAAVDKAKLTAILSLLPDAKRSVYMKIGLAGTGYSQDDIAALALGALKIRSMDATAYVANNINVTIDAVLSDGRLVLLQTDFRLLEADRQLLAAIKKTLNDSDDLNRSWLTADETARKQIEASLSDNRNTARQQLLFLNAFWDLADDDTDGNNEAVNELNGILSIDKANARALLWRGIACYYLDNYDQALKDLALAANNPDTGKSAYYYIGSCYYMQGKYDLAINAYSKSIDIGKPDSKAYLYRGNCYRKTGRNDLAIADYSKAVDADPDNAAAYGFRGDCYLYSGKYSEAAKDYDVVIRAKKADGYIYFNRGAIYMKNNDVDDAMRCFEQTTKMLPEYADGYFNEALAYDQKLYLVKKNHLAGDQAALARSAVNAYKKFVQLADPKRAEIKKAQKRISALSSSTVLDI